MTDAQFILSLPASKIRMMKRMINALCRLGVSREAAVEMVIGLVRDENLNRKVLPRAVNKY